MKTPHFLLLTLSASSFVACQNPFQRSPEPQPVPKVVTYQKPKTTTWKPKKTAVVNTTSAETVIEDPISPLTPDPTNTLHKTEIPKFEVPDNIQPKVADGIDQGAFIELRWTN